MTSEQVGRQNRPNRRTRDPELAFRRAHDAVSRSISRASTPPRTPFPRDLADHITTRIAVQPHDHPIRDIHVDAIEPQIHRHHRTRIHILTTHRPNLTPMPRRHPASLIQIETDDLPRIPAPTTRLLALHALDDRRTPSRNSRPMQARTGPVITPATNRQPSCSRHRDERSPKTRPVRHVTHHRRAARDPIHPGQIVVALGTNLVP